MSSTLSDIDDHSINSSEDESNKDYGDEDGYDVLYPSEPPKSSNASVRSVKVHVPPAMLKIENQIRDILGEITDEYATFLSTIIYESKYNNKPLPPKFKIIGAYIEKRMNDK